MGKTNKALLAGLAASGLLAACGSGGVSTNDAQAAAKQRLARSLGLTKEATLLTDVFVGTPRDDDPVMCGTVQGRKADGAAVGPRRFVMGTDPAGWLYFETLQDARQPDTIARTSTDMFVDEWARYCAGERGR